MSYAEVCSPSSKKFSIGINYTYEDPKSQMVKAGSLTFPYEILLPPSDASDYTISASAPPPAAYSIHWNDIEGKPVTKDMKPWAKQNLFNCESEDSLGGFGEGVN